MPKVFLYVFFVYKTIGEKWKTFCRTEKSTHGCPLPPVSSHCLFWLSTLLWLESPFLAGNVFSQVGQQCQTDLKEVVLSHISLDYFFFPSNVTCSKWSDVTRDDLLLLSSNIYHIAVLVDNLILLKFSFKQSLYFICWPLGKCLLSLFAAWIFSWSILISQIFE